MNRYQICKPPYMFGTMVGILSMALTLAQPVLAADPFRTQNPRPIGNKTEAAFRALFEKGNYREAKSQLEQALKSDGNDPLVYGMRASLAYIESDLETMQDYGKKTREVAEKLSQKDPLRGNIYTAVSIFLEGAYQLQKEGTVKGGAKALNQLQEVFKYLDAANQIDPNDPELNLMRGYMDLMLAANLPFANPQQAIDRLENQGAPRYLAYRGIALGYRDMKKYDKALEYVDKALAETPNNPELNYLKAQILSTVAQQEKNNQFLQQAKTNFEIALAKPDQLPKTTFLQIFLEHCKNLDRLDNQNRHCRSQVKGMKTNLTGIWGPPNLPPL